MSVRVSRNNYIFSMRLWFLCAFALLVLAFPILAQEKNRQEKPKADEELTKLAGAWKVVSFSGHDEVRFCAERIGHDGNPLPSPAFTINGDQLTTENEVLVFSEPLGEFNGNKIKFGQEYKTRAYRLQSVKSTGGGPLALDVIIGKDVALKGIYELKGDELKLCVVNRLFCEDKDVAAMAKKAADTARPTDFSTKNGGRTVTYVLKRENK